jgi:uncharacterized protein YndB with AHSA1/START domain
MAELELRREFDAPRERVWAEWTQAERFAEWYGGAEATLDVHEWDLRPGGGWCATMRVAGRTIDWHGEFVEIAEPARLVFTVTDAPGDARELVTVELHDLGDGRTEMHFTQGEGMTPDQYRAAGQGWGTFFDVLAARLAA